MTPPQRRTTGQSEQPSGNEQTTAAAAIRERKRRETDERLKRPGGARRIRSAEMPAVTFGGLTVADLPRPPHGE